MTPAQAIAPIVLEAATRRLVACSEFGARLGWWLQHGHSSERWVQFEWAYQLQQEVSPDFAVLCEHHRLDVSLVASVNATRPLSAGVPLAGVELKWWGNWWVDRKAVEKLAADLGKVDVYKFPAVALLLFLLVESVDSDPVYDWIRAQLDAGKGVRDIPTLRRDFLSLLPGSHFEASVEVQWGASFANVSLHAFAFLNQCAYEGRL